MMNAIKFRPLCAGIVSAAGICALPTAVQAHSANYVVKDVVLVPTSVRQAWRDLVTPVPVEDRRVRAHDVVAL